MRRTIAFLLMFGGIAMIVLPWLYSRSYVGSLDKVMSEFQTGDPSLMLDMTSVLETSMVFGVLTSLAGIILASNQIKRR